MQTVLPVEIILQLIQPILSQSETTCHEYHENLPYIEEEQKANIMKKTMQTILPAEVIIQRILPLAPQLGTTCHEYHEHLPHIDETHKGNIKFPSVENKNPVFIKQGNIRFEYEAKIDFKKLNELIEHHDVQTLHISTHHPIFLEIKKIFEVILTMDRNVIDGWKYKNTFIRVDEDHYDKNKTRKPTFVQMDWMNSFVTSFIFYLYH
jgi:hypothetical protein